MPIRIFTLRGDAKQAEERVQWTTRLFDLVEDFIGIPYAYGKLDFVAVPATGDNWAAMENPGLVTFHHRRLVHGWIDTTIHEAAHQWFGNFVSPATWREVWLNEGFAVWLTEKLVARLGVEGLDEGEWSSNRSFPPEPKSVRAPIEDTHSARDLSSYFFGWYGYQVVARFENFIGEAKFVERVRAYLNKHAHGNATTEDLASSLFDDEVLARALVANAEKPPYKFARLYTSLDCEPGKYVLRLSVADAGGPIPVCIAHEEKDKRAEVCTTIRDSAVELPLTHCPRWILTAGRTSGFYWPVKIISVEKLVDDLAWPHLLPDEQQAVLRDAENDHALALRVAVKLLQSTDAISVDTGARHLLPLVNVVPDDLRPQFHAFVKTTIQARARAALGDPRTLLDNRSTIALAAAAGDDVIRREAGRRAVQKLHKELQFFTEIAHPIVSCDKACLHFRKQLEPAFRAWLRVKSSK